jgi:hypothetical protein
MQHKCREQIYYMSRHICFLREEKRMFWSWSISCSHYFFPTESLIWMYFISRGKRLSVKSCEIANPGGVQVFLGGNLERWRTAPQVYRYRYRRSSGKLSRINLRRRKFSNIDFTREIPVCYCTRISKGRNPGCEMPMCPYRSKHDYTKWWDCVWFLTPK